ncbi:MAG TPA: hypothetical protein PKN75_07545 [Bacteroidia bacterium]|nr:hypothetical protein [Bacteroidia bacterium]HNU33432.1 hypothetical protein [Bacteroidia bacterium]
MKKLNLNSVTLLHKKVCVTIVKILLLFGILLISKVTKAQLWPVYPVTITNAAELYAALYDLAKPATANAYGLTCSTKVVVNFAPDVEIQLGDLTPDVFPLWIPAGVILQGDYKINNLIPNEFSTNNGIATSHGTRILFPYMYSVGYECNGNITNGNTPLGAAFRMREGSELRNVKLQGYRNDIISWRWEFFENMCLGFSNAANTAFNPEMPIEGLSTGILANGNNIVIEECEISGFVFFGVIIRDMVQTPNLGTRFCDTNPGSFTFRKNFIHNCKTYGWGYGLWVSAGGQLHCNIDEFSPVFSCIPQADPLNPIIPTTYFNFDAPNEIALIDSCTFFDNKHDIASTNRRNSMTINENTFGIRSIDHNLDRHTEGINACNPNQLAANCATCIATPTYRPPQSCNEVITTLGGHRTLVERNMFYRPVNNINVPYPNINQCEVNGNPDPFLNSAVLQIIRNWFNTNYTAATPNTEVPFRITINDVWHTQWGFAPGFPTAGGCANTTNDENLEIGEDIEPNPENTYDQLTTANTNLGIPWAQVAGSNDGGATWLWQPQTVTEGSTWEFSGEFCLNGAGIPIRGFDPDSNVLIWRFHTMADDIADEIRTRADEVVNFTFSQPGIILLT